MKMNFNSNASVYNRRRAVLNRACCGYLTMGLQGSRESVEDDNISDAGSVKSTTSIFSYKTWKKMQKRKQKSKLERAQSLVGETEHTCFNKETLDRFTFNPNRRQTIHGETVGSNGKEFSTSSSEATDKPLQSERNQKIKELSTIFQSPLEPYYSSSDLKGPSSDEEVEYRPGNHVEQLKSLPTCDEHKTTRDWLISGTFGNQDVRKNDLKTSKQLKRQIVLAKPANEAKSTLSEISTFKSSICGGGLNEFAVLMCSDIMESVETAMESKERIRASYTADYLKPGSKISNDSLGSNVTNTSNRTTSFVFDSQVHSFLETAIDTSTPKKNENQKLVSVENNEFTLPNSTLLSKLDGKYEGALSGNNLNKDGPKLSVDTEKDFQTLKGSIDTSFSHKNADDTKNGLLYLNNVLCERVCHFLPENRETSNNNSLANTRYIQESLTESESIASEKSSSENYNLTNSFKTVKHDRKSIGNVNDFVSEFSLIKQTPIKAKESPSSAKSSSVLLLKNARRRTEEESILEGTLEIDQKHALEQSEDTNNKKLETSAHVHASISAENPSSLKCSDSAAAHSCQNNVGKLPNDKPHNRLIEMEKNFDSVHSVDMKGLLGENLSRADIVNNRLSEKSCEKKAGFMEVLPTSGVRSCSEKPVPDKLELNCEQEIFERVAVSDGIIAQQFSAEIPPSEDTSLCCCKLM